MTDAMCWDQRPHATKRGSWPVDAGCNQVPTPTTSDHVTIKMCDGRRSSSLSSTEASYPLDIDSLTALCSPMTACADVHRSCSTMPVPPSIQHLFTKPGRAGRIGGLVGAPGWKDIPAPASGRSAGGMSKTDAAHQAQHPMPNAAASASRGWSQQSTCVWNNEGLHSSSPRSLSDFISSREQAKEMGDLLSYAKAEFERNHGTGLDTLEGSFKRATASLEATMMGAASMCAEARRRVASRASSVPPPRRPQALQERPNPASPEAPLMPSSGAHDPLGGLPGATKAACEGGLEAEPASVPSPTTAAATDAMMSAFAEFPDFATACGSSNQPVRGMRHPINLGKLSLGLENRPDSASSAPGSSSCGMFRRRQEGAGSINRAGQDHPTQLCRSMSDPTDTNDGPEGETEGERDTPMADAARSPHGTPTCAEDEPATVDLSLIGRSQQRSHILLREHPPYHPSATMQGVGQSQHTATAGTTKAAEAPGTAADADPVKVDAGSRPAHSNGSAQPTQAGTATPASAAAAWEAAVNKINAGMGATHAAKPAPSPVRVRQKPLVDALFSRFAATSAGQHPPRVPVSSPLPSASPLGRASVGAGMYSVPGSSQGIAEGSRTQQCGSKRAAGEAADPEVIVKKASTSYAAPGPASCTPDWPSAAARHRHHNAPTSMPDLRHAWGACGSTHAQARTAESTGAHSGSSPSQAPASTGGTSAAAAQPAGLARPGTTKPEHQAQPKAQRHHFRGSCNTGSESKDSKTRATATDKAFAALTSDFAVAATPCLMSLSDCELRLFLSQAGAAVEAHQCTGRCQLLSLAQSKMGAWEVRRVLAAARLTPPAAAHRAVLRINTGCQGVGSLPEPLPDKAGLLKAYRELALKLHPDKHPGDTDKATAAFQALQESYRTLKNDQGHQAPHSHHSSGQCSHQEGQPYCDNPFWGFSFGSWAGFWG